MVPPTGNKNAGGTLTRDSAGDLKLPRPEQIPRPQAGGSFSLINVVPGGGKLAPVASFSILGVGFSPKTQVTVRELNTSSIQYVSPTEIRVRCEMVACWMAL